VSDLRLAAFCGDLSAIRSIGRVDLPGEPWANRGDHEIYLHLWWRSLRANWPLAVPVALSAAETDCFDYPTFRDARDKVLTAVVTWALEEIIL